MSAEAPADVGDQSRLAIFLVEATLVATGWYLGLWWFKPSWAKPELLVPVILATALFSAYFLYISPFLIHRDDRAVHGFRALDKYLLRLDNLSIALKNYGGFTLVAAFILIASALWMDERIVSVKWLSLVSKLIMYYFSALMQDLIFFEFFFVRFAGVLATREPGASVGRKMFACVLTAFVYAIIHTPNYPLVLFCFAAGLVWAWFYLDTPNLMVLAASHAILGTLLHQLVELNMRIGIHYYSPKTYLLREVFPFSKELLK